MVEVAVQTCTFCIGVSSLLSSVIPICTIETGGHSCN